MSFNCDWNEEISAQFYSTIYIDRYNKVMHWTIQGNPLLVAHAQFAQILWFSSDDPTEEKIHEREIEFGTMIVGLSLGQPKIHERVILADGDMHFMYDSAYGEIKFGTIKGMKPYHKMLNQLFFYTVCPKVGDVDNVSNISKNLLARMTPNMNEFSVFDLIWEEIIMCLVSPKKLPLYMLPTYLV